MLLRLLTLAGALAGAALLFSTPAFADVNFAWGPNGFADDGFPQSPIGIYFGDGIEPSTVTPIVNGLPNSPTIGEFDDGWAYNSGGILPWDYGLGMAGNWGVLQSVGTPDGIVAVAGQYNAATQATDVVSFGNNLFGGWCVVCNDLGVVLPQITPAPITIEFNLFTNALPQLEIDIPPAIAGGSGYETISPFFWDPYGAGSTLADAAAIVAQHTPADFWYHLLPPDIPAP